MKGILLWLVGIPIPIIILLWLFGVLMKSMIGLLDETIRPRADFLLLLRVCIASCHSMVYFAVYVPVGLL